MTQLPQRVSAYVDGFNLYHGMHQARGRRGLWLDLESMVGSFLRENQQLVLVNYFTAMVEGPGRGQGRGRQQTYLNALAAHNRLVVTHVGRFQAKTMQCRMCRSTWNSYEEKESDVSLAVRLVEDAAAGRCDVALLLTADSDMLPAVRAARRLAPAMRIVVGFPPRRSSVALRSAPEVAATFRIGDRVPERHQLPDLVPHPDGPIVRPAHWR